MDNIRGLAAGNYERQTYVQETADKKVALRDASSAEVKNDNAEVKVSLSSGSRELQMAKDAAVSASSGQDQNERAERVEQIRQDVEEGRYQVNPQQVAEKIVGLVIDEFV